MVKKKLQKIKRVIKETKKTVIGITFYVLIFIPFVLIALIMSVLGLVVGRKEQHGN